MGRIRWHFAPEGASIYTAPNIFFPLSQTLQYKPTDGVGEMFGGGYPYFRGEPFANWVGDAPHGTAADFAGETYYDGPTPIEDVPACAFDPAEFTTCGFCGDVPMPRVIRVRLITDDYPEFDGAIITLPLSVEHPCSWSGAEFLPFDAYNLEIGDVGAPDSHSLFFNFAPAGDPLHAPNVITTILPEELTCYPFGFDITREVGGFGATPGTHIRFVTVADGDYGTRKATLEFGGEAKRPLQVAGGVELGGESTLHVASHGGIELGGESSSHVIRSGGIELGGESDLRLPSRGGIELGGDSKPRFPSRVVIEFGRRNTQRIIFNLSGGMEFGGESTIE